MALRESKNISFSPELARFVEARVASGQYQSASEVVRAGLRLLQEFESHRPDALQDVRQKILAGLEQARRGELVDGPASFAKARKKLQKKLDRRE